MKYTCISVQSLYFINAEISVDFKIFIELLNHSNLAAHSSVIELVIVRRVSQWQCGYFGCTFLCKALV